MTEAFTPSVLPETSQSEEDIPPGNGPEILQDLLQHRTDPSDTGRDHESFLTPLGGQRP